MFILQNLNATKIKIEEKIKMKKICIIGMFVLLTFIPIINAVDITTDSNNELNENSVSLPTNDDIEIISFLSGGCETVNTYGLVFNASIDLWTGDFSFRIYGLKQPVTGLLDIFFDINNLTYTHITASHFYGWIHKVDPYSRSNVWGIALVNIEIETKE